MKKIYLYTLPILGIFAFAAMNVNAQTTRIHHGIIYVATNGEHGNVAQKEDFSKAKPDAFDGSVAMNDNEVLSAPDQQPQNKITKTKHKRKNDMVKTAFESEINSNETTAGDQTAANIAQAEKNNNSSTSNASNQNKQVDSNNSAEPSYD